MKPAPFTYHRPAALDEAIALLERYEGEAKVLAGGQSLMPIVNMRLARPSALIDLRDVPGLAGMRREDGRLAFGAMTRHRAVEQAAEVREHLPLLVKAMRYVGHLAIRSRGTIGGSLAHADPAAELPALATLFDARFTIAGPGGARTVDWKSFFVSYLATCLEPAEILTGVSFAIPPPETRSSFREIARRHGDFALVGLGALVRCDEAAGTIAEARLALFGVGATPVRLLEAERSLAGMRPDAGAFDDVARDAVAALEPNDDVHASAAYRRDVARTLIVEALRETAVLPSR